VLARPLNLLFPPAAVTYWLLDENRAVGPCS
jgi:hypothetical protein